MTERTFPVLFALGEPHPALKNRVPLPEGMVASLTFGPTLTMILHEPTPRDIRLTRNNRIRIGLVPLLPHGYVWLVEINDVAVMEAPFAPGLEAIESQQLTKYTPGDASALSPACVRHEQHHSRDPRIHCDTRLLGSAGPHPCRSPANTVRAGRMECSRERFRKSFSNPEGRPSRQQMPSASAA